MKTGKTNTTYGMANATEAYNEDDSSDLEKMQNSYKHNEDRNNHSENILMLAQAFGSRPEIKAVEGLLTIIRRQGYTTPEQSEMMYNAIHKKYYSQLFPAENEGNEFSGELAKAKIDGKKEFKVDGKTYKVKEALSKLLDSQKTNEAGIMHYSDAKGTSEYKEGQKAAKNGEPYDSNPYSGADKLKWSKGHNEWRHANKRKKGEPNYGARGQFESVEESYSDDFQYSDDYSDDDDEIGASAEDLVDIIMHRIKMNKPLMLALLGDEGPGPLMNAVEDVADFYSGTTEVGSSDVSAMVDAVKRTLFPIDYHKFDSEPYGEAYNPETGLDPNVDTTEWDELIAKAKKKQEKEYANSKAGKRDPAYRHYHQYKTQ
jgi:hypothetical protein